MSVAATGWAFRQRVPPKPKFVLLALADQTDERTGRVCYGKTDMKYLAEKCSVGERSLYRYIAALIRNGYMLKESGKEKGLPSAYWLCLDRPLADNIDEFQWIGEPIEDPQDVEDGSAKLAEGPEGEADSESVDSGRGGMPQDGRPKESAEVPKNIVASAKSSTAVGFSREAQDTEIERGRLEQQAAKAGAKVFILKGSRAWVAWCDWRRRHGQIASLPTTQAVIGGKGALGWWMPTLFPPQESATGPPTVPAQWTEDDESVLANNFK